MQILSSQENTVIEKAAIEYKHPQTPRDRIAITRVTVYTRILGSCQGSEQTQSFRASTIYESQPQPTKDLLHWQIFHYFHEADDNVFGQQTSCSMDFQVGYKNKSETIHPI